MRISVKQDDVGYRPDAYKYHILFNGERIQNCFTADEELGCVHIYAGEDMRQVLFGDVKIINPEKEKFKKKYPTLSENY